jgi:hypothetical protein
MPGDTELLELVILLKLLELLDLLRLLELLPVLLPLLLPGEAEQAIKIVKQIATIDAK